MGSGISLRQHIPWIAWKGKNSITFIRYICTREENHQKDNQLFFHPPWIHAFAVCAFYHHQTAIHSPANETTNGRPFASDNYAG